MAKRYFYKQIEVVPYWNGYRPYYIHEDGTRELLAVGTDTRAKAYEIGRQEVDAMNRRANNENN